MINHKPDPKDDEYQENKETACLILREYILLYELLFTEINPDFSVKL